MDEEVAEGKWLYGKEVTGDVQMSFCFNISARIITTRPRLKWRPRCLDNRTMFLT